MTTETTTTKTASKGQPIAKTATISLTANGTTLRIRARCKSDGTAETFVTTTDAAKKTERGMTERHASFDAAKTAIAASAAKAEKLGWSRRSMGRGLVTRPDAFTALPAPPKNATTKKAVS